MQKCCNNYFITPKNHEQSVTSLGLHCFFFFKCRVQPLFISDSEHLNNMAQTSMMIAQPYPVLGPISSPYEQPAKDLNTYATLKAVGKNLTIKNSHPRITGSYQ